MLTLEVILNSCFLLHSISVNNTTTNPVNQIFLRPPLWSLGPCHQPSCSMWYTTTALPGLPTHPAVANSLCSSSSDAPKSLTGTFQFIAPNSPMASSNTGIQFKILTEASMVLLWPCLFCLPDLISCCSPFHPQWSSHTELLGTLAIDQALKNLHVLFLLPGMLFLHIPYLIWPLSVVF